jgi:hypothetical protein
MSAQSDPRRPTGGGAVAESKYYYRRSLNARELLPAIGAAIGAGVVVFYLAKLFLERTPLTVESRTAELPRLGLRRSPPSAISRNAGRR